jgi:hypothetical protein
MLIIFIKYDYICKLYLMLWQIQDFHYYLNTVKF